MILLILRWFAAIVLAFAIGKLVSKLKLPSILGWLIGGMILGPYALSLLPNELLEAGWYQNIVHVLECAVGLMIGTELVWKRMKRYGKALMITTLTQSLGTFAVVSAVFGLVFCAARNSDIPGVYFRRDRPCHSARAGPFHCAGIQNGRPGDQEH
jgi:Kef-type K+ transport system membrane component KefB